MKQHTFSRFTAIILIIEGLLIFVPLLILGSTIDWPASVNAPAQTILPLILQQRTATLVGYSVYLVYSLLIWPVALITTEFVEQFTGKTTLLRIATGFGLASAILRALGILRWLVPMFVLANAYVEPGISAQEKAVVTLIFQTLNTYAGGLGEILGVGLVAALWLGLLSLQMLRSSLPKWLGVFGTISALFLLTGVLRVFGVDAGPLLSIISVTLLQFWFLAFGIFLLLRSRKASVKVSLG